MNSVVALSEETKKQLASSWARITKEKLGKGPSGISVECCGGVLMVTMHQTLTPLERTAGQAAGEWGPVLGVRELAMQVLVADFTRTLNELGYSGLLLFSEIDTTADRQMIGFRISSRPQVAPGGRPVRKPPNGVQRVETSSGSRVGLAHPALGRPR